MLKKILIGILITSGLALNADSLEFKKGISLDYDPLVVGENTLKIIGLKENQLAKIKVFMPEMPGMPYMETKSKFKNSKANINLSMSGTWQVQLFIKTKDKIDKYRGSFNL